MRYITATELQNWQKTRQSEEKLPLLLRRLIINLLEFKNINFIDIPGGDSIWKPGVEIMYKKYDLLCGRPELP